MNKTQFLSGDRNMTLTVGIKGDFTLQEVSEVIRAALEQNERVAEYKIKKHSNICESFEKRYGMNSELFMENLIPENSGMTMNSSTGMHRKEALISGIRS